MANTYSAGIVTAYGAAKKAGYTGTYEEFCAEQASFAQNAQQVRQDKESVEQTVETFSETTVPEAVQSVTDEGDTQIDRVEAAGNRAVEAVGNAGTSAVRSVNEAGTTQVGNVQNEGNTQIQAVEDKGAEVLETIPADYTELSNAVFNDVTGLDTKAPVILETASGAIASFDDGADSMPIKKLVAQIEPVQDLHGYDNPWPAGGGKNLVPMTTLDDIKAHNTSGTWNGADYSRDGITFTVLTDNAGNVLGFKLNGTSTEGVSFQVKGTDEFTLAAGSYYYTGVSESNGGYDLNLRKAGTTTDIVQRGAAVTLNLEEDTSFSSMYIWVNSGKTITNAYVYPMIRNSTVSDATFAPYSNICPISGWTGAEVTRTGKNLCQAITDHSSGQKIFQYRAYYADTDYGYPRMIGYWKPGTYTISFDAETSTAAAKIRLWVRSAEDGNVYNLDSSGNFVAASAEGTQNVFSVVRTDTNSVHITGTIKINKSVDVIALGYREYNVSKSYDNLQIEPGSTATAYEPYTGNQISVNWEDEAGTVYGGTLTLNPDRTGTLAATLKEVDMGSLDDWSYQSTNTCFYCDLQDKKDGLCTAITPITKPADATYRVPGYCLSTSNAVPKRIFTSFPEYTTVAAFKAAMTGVPLIYELEEPVVYHLTESEVSGILSTLYGTNNVWADTGDVEVTYPADTKLFIEKLTQPTEDDMTADHAIASGTFFQLGNTLYLATAQIAAGDTITPGTNATQLSIADALNQLNA